MPLFSIISPVYNVDKYLERCINSVINQTFSDFEYILIDDGSTDLSGSICDEFAERDSRIKVIHKDNGGVSSARNSGIDASLGRWILFVDSDDTLDINALAVIKDSLNNNDVDLLIYGINTISKDGIVKASSLNLNKRAFYNKDSIRSALLPYACCSSSFVNSPCNKVYSSSLVQKEKNYFPSRVRGEDWLFNVKYLQCIASAMSIEDTLYNYYLHTGSAMTKFVPEQFVLWEENWDVKKTLIQRYSLSVDVRQMRREMLVKVFYFVKEVLSVENRRDAKTKLSYISRSDLLKECLSAVPRFLIEIRAFVYLSVCKLAYK